MKRISLVAAAILAMQPLVAIPQERTTPHANNPVVAAASDNGQPSDNISLPDDALDEALRYGGMSRSDLGYSPRGWWMRYPRDTLHKLPHFDDIIREPLAGVPFTRTLASAVKTFLGPESLSRPGREEWDEQGGHSLYHLVHTAIERRFGGIRVSSPRLQSTPITLEEAILQAHRDAGEPTKFHTARMDAPNPDIAADVARRTKWIPPEVNQVLGRLVTDLVEARRWADLSFRNVTLEQRSAISRRFGDQGATMVTAGLEYQNVYQFDDVAKSWDEASLWHGGLKTVEALDRAQRSLSIILRKKNIPGSFDWETPYGWIRIRGTGDDKIDADDSFLIVDLGGNDEWAGAAGSSTPLRVLGAALDLSGDDRYVGGSNAQGAGIAGIGVLMDAMGNDSYQAADYSQGIGQFGLGALIDLAGKDSYRATNSAQGASPFAGVGLLADVNGDDSYYVLADGQGHGGPGGVGLLADRAGNDTYQAELDPEKSGRGGYANTRWSNSTSQGFGVGRYYGFADAHSWAGGLGALIDVEGDDKYSAGSWSQGTGFWFGTGILYDGLGNDEYKGGEIFTQAAAAHYAIGILIDEAGNDTHQVQGGLGLSAAHDLSVSLLVSSGGDDSYQIDGSGIAHSLNRSFSLFVDSSGKDKYRFSKESPPGTAEYEDRLAINIDGTGVLYDPAYKTSPIRLNPFYAYVKSAAVFLDIGGDDQYFASNRNNTSWRDEPGSKNWKIGNVGVGMDVAAGLIDWAPLSRPPAH